MHKSCKSCTKKEAFLARYKTFCKIFARKKCKIVFLQFFLARFLQDLLYLARKASFLLQDLQDFMQDFAASVCTDKLYPHQTRTIT